ncbi:CLUMA_CG012744, isoform A [Clunio marinus]|uniref:CLUMA_CG012744, isoform A n=1 Tax=Clunio marinus TaxID=568069 RepID=A0A1J1ILX9_9DIPT|nr:CLUMA_CG012744, isoform A [Clunio marinus]
MSIYSNNIPQTIYVNKKICFIANYNAIEMMMVKFELVDNPIQHLEKYLSKPGMKYSWRYHCIEINL